MLGRRITRWAILFMGASAATAVALLSSGVISASSAAPRVQLTAKNCSDTTIATTSNVYAGPYFGGTVYGTYKKGTNANLDCYYYNNTDEGKWFAELRYGTRIGYVWVQNFKYGSEHQCLIDGRDRENIGYGNYCDLINYP